MWLIPSENPVLIHNCWDRHEDLAVYRSKKKRLTFRKLQKEVKEIHSMVIETVAFTLFALATLGCSLGVVLSSDVFTASLLLGAALVSVAIHYVMLQAEFLAAIQILVYIGGVLILITFAVMLTRTDSRQEVQST